MTAAAIRRSSVLRSTAFRSTGRTKGQGSWRRIRPRGRSTNSTSITTTTAAGIITSPPASSRTSSADCGVKWNRATGDLVRRKPPAVHFHLSRKRNARRRCDSSRAASTAGLPDADRLHRAEQHHHVEHKAVANPDEQHELERQKQRERFPQTEPARDPEPGPTTRDVPQRVEDRVPFITQRRRHRAIAVDDECRVLKDLPA